MNLDNLTKKPLEIGEVIIRDALSVNANVVSDTALGVGTILVSADNGESFIKSNGEGDGKFAILADNIKKGCTAKVMLIGVAKQVGEVSDTAKTNLFKNNLILI